MITRILILHKTSKNICKPIQLSGCVDQKYKNIFKYDRITKIVPTNFNGVSQNSFIKNNKFFSTLFNKVKSNNNSIFNNSFYNNKRSFTTGSNQSTSPITPQRNSNSQNTQDVKSTNNVRPEFVIALLFVSVLFYIASKQKNGTNQEIELINKSLERIEETIKRNNNSFLGGDKYTRQLEKTLQFIGIISLILSVIRLLVFKKL